MSDEKCPRCGAGLHCKRLELIEDYSEESVATFDCGTRATTGGSVMLETIACLRRQLAQAKEESKKLWAALSYIKSAIGEGGRRGRPMDLMTEASWKRWRELYQAAANPRPKGDQQ